MLAQDLFDWILLLGRWFHITVAATWIGTSFFFMWLDRSFVKNSENNNEGYIGELWMVHGGGFYKVEKMLMGPTKVPPQLHWFKWESYWTWISGMFLLVLTYYTGGGTYLIDTSIADISYSSALGLSLFSIFGSWFFYDLLWETKLTKNMPLLGHLLTFAWLVFMTVLLCNQLSGRAAYIHIGAMLGTWMAGNVFMRIIPRQLKMVESSKNGTPVNQEWSMNAKNRSTHNTYFTLPVIFIMLSNHFPNTYGHDLNWLLLIFITISGALIRQYFVIKDNKPKAAKYCAIASIFFLFLTIFISKESEEAPEPKKETHDHHKQHKADTKKTVKSLKTKHHPSAVVTSLEAEKANGSINGVIHFVGIPKKGKKLRLPGTCKKMHKGKVYSDEVRVKNGKLENAFVRISTGLENKIYKTIPKTPVEINQIGCVYKPRVIAAVAGQEVVFINSDPVFHNVKSITKNNKRFNVAMPKQNQRVSKVFKTPELFVETKCSVHPWMSAYIAVVDHPFFDVSNDKGEFKISNIPQGKFTLEVWHEVYGTQTNTFEISKDGEVKKLNFTFKQP